MKFAAIADWAESDSYTVTFMCAQLGVSTSGYYKWRGKSRSARDLRDDELTALIEYHYEHLNGRPGVRRMRAELAAGGHRVSHKRVWRLMKVAGLEGRHPKAWKRTTVAGDSPVGAPDLIGRDFTAAEANTKWCGDITYVRTWNGWAYLATVIDLHSRMVVGWAVADHMRTELVTDALDMAIARRRPPGKVIFHSDRGTQYTSTDFDKYCTKNNIRRSLGRTGICFDNAVAESFFASYKKELIHTRPWPTLKALKKSTFTWIEEYYNRARRHSTLGYLTPAEFELGFRDIYDSPLNCSGHFSGNTPKREIVHLGLRSGLLTSRIFHEGGFFASGIIAALTVSFYGTFATICNFGYRNTCKRFLGLLRPLRVPTFAAVQAGTVPHAGTFASSSANTHTSRSSPP
ncbi:IS3 family transposase [Rhodococcoides fascians]|uniref:IS3 family transposase n=1 Tax=Rhodococcoides fascians TaxID=1828 RepID=UPI002ACE1830|nr:IS3 family transposase [Rhodococcus fascians]WQH26831.1 IS3 family transposase [Rhodococcus fascians]